SAELRRRQAELLAHLRAQGRHRDDDDESDEHEKEDVLDEVRATLVLDAELGHEPRLEHVQFSHFGLTPCGLTDWLRRSSMPNRAGSECHLRLFPRNRSSAPFAYGCPVRV